ncbi:hypothetical protein H9Q74_011112 [Fusarium xylarioides]|nr:hypothetical protein H9Q71_011379 [Fusarium xylarioides]KAG5816438.1 hypothetical protein H9Q74_011112 [Fusarium xylarioides]
MVLTQVYPNPDGTDNVTVEVDIIAVHGLNPRSKKETNHACDTWRTPAGPKGKLWLRDDLPKLVPSARIFVYEYDSTVVYGTNNSTFVDKANSLLESIRIKQVGQDEISLRPVILLGHSLGGLLIKQALINAYNNEKYKTVKLATQGLVFFATPHKGGRQGLVNLGQVASAIARNLGFEKGDNIIDTLEKEGMFSQLMGELWRHRLLEYPIISFWGEYDKIVIKESASFGLPGTNEHVVSLPASHDGICKFGDNQQDKDNLERVIVNIYELCHSAVSLRESLAFPKVPEGDPGRMTDAERWRS